MTTRSQLEKPASVRDIPTATEAFRQWHHAIGASADEIDEFAAPTPRQCHLPTIEEIMTVILEAKLGGSGSTCYINNVILAQLWNYTMSQTFNTAIWGTWEKQYLSMLVDHTGAVVDPYADHFLGRMFVDWFKSHSIYAQHDAGEFAGWFRQRLLQKTLPHYMQAGWNTRLLSSIEDQAEVFAPVPMACLVEGIITLQQLVLNWHHQEPFVHVFSCNSPWICLQVSRFPSIGLKSTCSVDWDRCIPLQIPDFNDCRGIHVEWHDFVMTTGIIHLGNAPTEGHYVASFGTMASSCHVIIFVLPSRWELALRLQHPFISFGLFPRSSPADSGSGHCPRSQRILLSNRFA